MSWRGQRYVWAILAVVAGCSAAGRDNGSQFSEQGSDQVADVVSAPGTSPAPGGGVPDAGGAAPRDGGSGAVSAPVDQGEGDAPVSAIHGFANGCYALGAADGRWLAITNPGDGFEWVTGDVTRAARFFMKASDLGTYLFYDQEGGYLATDTGPLRRPTQLKSDILLLDDSFVSPAEWELKVSVPDGSGYQLRHLSSDQYLAEGALVRWPDESLVLTLQPVEGCIPHPELTLDAEGEVQPRSFEDGSVYGIVDTHSHILSNFGFGGGGIFHGSAFHRLGVEHALSDCDEFHGNKGRKDVFGYGYDDGSGGLDAQTLLSILLAGQLSQDNHETEGYPTFTEWPNAPGSSTHQTQYYLWLQRAWMAGLRLVIQHATTNSVICEFTVGQNLQSIRYPCNDMVGVDRILVETRNMERYIDAQAGGPGKGFFRIVESPEEAREVIGQGKMAVVLGIETSNLFDCYSVKKDGYALCDEARVIQKLDEYHARGVRVLFPVHKYDNAFSAGDGNRDFIELGNFINSGHWSNFTEDSCPDVPTVFDKGKVSFGGLNQPRDEYMSPPPNNMSGFQNNPVLTLTPHLLRLTQGSLEGDYCQNHGMTPLGEFMMQEMMKRGMVIEIDHFSRRSYERAFQILEQYDYPAAATHGTNGPDGRLYALGGVSKTGLGRCRAPDRKGKMLDRLKGRIAQLEQYGAYPAEGFGFDLNGFAGAPGPRFGDKSGCGDPQEDRVDYPFSSYNGDVTFTQPSVGNRTIDFNTEGMVHIGLLPELLEDARRDAVSDAELEPLFRSAEGYLRMWERSEARGMALKSEL